MVIHRAPLGSHERFIAYLTEHFGGAFPVWLAPEQVQVIPVMPDLTEYAEAVNARLLGEGLRSEVYVSPTCLPQPPGRTCAHAGAADPGPAGNASATTG